MPANTPPFDISAIGDMVGKIAGDARKNMDKWWYPQTMGSPINNNIAHDSGLTEHLYTSLTMYALKKSKSVFRKVSVYADEHLVFSSETERSKFIKNLKGKTYFTRFNCNNNIDHIILIMDHGYASFNLITKQDNMHIIEYDAVSFDPKFITAHFNK